MTTRIARDKKNDTHRIKIVESDNNSELHSSIHDDIEMGRLMRENKMNDITGNDSFEMKRDMKSYNKASQKINDTNYSESDRKDYKNEMESIKDKYKKKKGWFS